MPSRRAQVDHFCAAFAPRGWQATSEGCWATLAYDGANLQVFPSASVRMDRGVFVRHEMARSALAASLSSGRCLL